MKRSDIQNAYEYITPDEVSRERMLNKIILSSEISPAGKDERKMRKKMKPMVIAALVGLMVLLMGCAVLAFSLQDMKIGEMTLRGQILDSEGNVLLDKDVPQDMISIHGYVNSPVYLAHQEWFEFEKTYDPDDSILFSSNDTDDFDPGDVYDAYNPYTQEMVDKVDEIAAKYGLKLLGANAVFQRWESQTFHDCLGIESLLVSKDAATITEMSGYFYEGGNFKVEFDMEMQDKKNDWSYPMFNTFYYSRKDYFDDTLLNVGDIELWDQWSYTTSSGENVLIACYDYGAVVFCDKEDSFIYVRIDNNHETDYNQKTGCYDTNIVMTKEQLEQVIDQIDFSVEVETVNMDLAREKLEQFQNLG